MLALTGQTRGSHISPDEFNTIALEIQNLIEDAGLTLTDGTINQLAIAIADYVTRSQFYTGGGTAADHTLTSIGNMEGPDAYQDGMRVFWRPLNASVNGGTTIDVNGLGQKTLLQEDGTAIIANDLIVTKDAEARYDGTNFFLIGA